jgi:predicted HAD superfamily Cof-like phosphohydrolase
MRSAMVTEFMRAFNAPRDLETNVRGLNEELVEFEAALENLLKEACDVLYCSYCVGASRTPDGKPGKVDATTVAAIKRVLEITDGLFGDAVFKEAFARVHASNMSKRGPNGEIERHPWGKIAKGPFYQPPVLHDLVT